MAKRGPHAKTLPQQFLALRRLPLTTRVGLRRNRLHWQGKLQPTPTSDTYLIEIEYAGAGRPAVRVLSPELDVPDDALPHTFRDGDLCLHLPGEWNAGQLIAHSIVPWASEWLLHYELWRATGEWLGGGHEPASDGSE